MQWYKPERWFNLTAGAVIVGLVILIVFTGTIIVGISLWYEPLSRSISSFLEISEVFPTKAIALFTGLSTFSTLCLAFIIITALKHSRDINDIDRKERMLNEVIDWAISISEANLELEKIIHDEQMGTRTLAQAKLPETLVKFQKTWEYSKYIADTVLRLDDSLSNAVNKLKDNLRIQTDLINLITIGISSESTMGKGKVTINGKLFDRDDEISLLSTRRSALVKYIDDVLKEVSKSKTASLNFPA